MKKKKISFKGKAIYNPSGKAGEYSYWACNFYVGCSNGCTYCYLKKGRGAKVLGGNEPTLKKCFTCENYAIDIFINELTQNIKEIKKHGLFFSFTTDPMIEETRDLTIKAIMICNSLKVPVKILTKESGYINQISDYAEGDLDYSLIAIGMTLTGHDELEPNVRNNEQRINIMRVCKSLGYKTFSSIEPIIDFESSKRMIDQALPYCDLFKVGLESGKKYDEIEALHFVEWISDLSEGKFYIKESLRKLTKHKMLSSKKRFVDRDYNLFND